MADTFSEELVDFIGDVLQLAWKISAHLAPTNTDTPEKVSIKREGIGAILEKIAKCLVILSTKLTSSETESWLLKVTEGQTGDQELDPGSFVLTLASIMKNSNKMSNEFALVAISRLLSSTLEILAKIQIQQKRLFEFTNLHIKSKIWILVLRESLELMNLNFESTKNWPRIEQSLLTLLRSSELFPLVHYPVFENCKLMAKYKLSPQKDLMHCLWSNASKCWFIERLCFQATIAVSRTAHGHPLDLVPTTIYSPNQSTDDQSFMNKLAAMMKQDIPKNTNNFHIPFTVFYLLNEEMVNTLRNSMSAIKLEGQKLTKKRQRSSPQRVRQEKKSAEAAINSLEETVRVISTLCQDLDSAVVTARKRTVLKDQIGQCLSSLNSLYRKL
eukprot:g3666.t1